MLVAISGGPDSVVLADALRSLPYSISLGHVNHQLRTGSGRDAAFVRRLASGWDIPCRVEQVNVRAFSRSKKLGLEEAARELRYNALSRMAQAAGCRVIVTAHTADDQAETVLFNLLRGAGPSGLAGIPPIRRMKGAVLIRPMLQITREEVLSYVKEHRLRPRQDPTNRHLRFTRNRIRHLTLPYLSRQFPGLAVRLVQSGEILREEEGFWQEIVSKELAKTARNNSKRITIDLTHFLGYHKALGRRILRRLLPGLTFQEIERVFSLARSTQGTGRLQLGAGLLVTRQAEKMVIRGKL